MNINSLQLRTQRKQLGLSLPALAFHGGISRWRLIQFELGNLTLTPDEFERINAALHRRCNMKIRELSKLLREGPTTKEEHIDPASL
jgi:predicted transcriptional regulator